MFDLVYYYTLLLYDYIQSTLNVCKCKKAYVTIIFEMLFYITSNKFSKIEIQALMSNEK